MIVVCCGRLSVATGHVTLSTLGQSTLALRARPLCWWPLRMPIRGVHVPAVNTLRGRGAHAGAQVGSGSNRLGGRLAEGAPQSTSMAAASPGTEEVGCRRRLRWWGLELLRCRLGCSRTAMITHERSHGGTHPFYPEERSPGGHTRSTNEERCHGGRPLRSTFHVRRSSFHVPRSSVNP